MSIAKGLFLLQSTVFSLAGICLIIPQTRKILMTRVIAGVIAAGPALIGGALLILAGALFCTAAGNLNNHVRNAVVQGNLIVAAAFAYVLWMNENDGPYFTSHFLKAGLAYFAAVGVLTAIVSPSSAKMAADKPKKA